MDEENNDEREEREDRHRLRNVKDRKKQALHERAFRHDERERNGNDDGEKIRDEKPRERREERRAHRAERHIRGDEREDGEEREDDEENDNDNERREGGVQTLPEGRGVANPMWRPEWRMCFLLSITVIILQWAASKAEWFGESTKKGSPQIPLPCS